MVITFTYTLLQPEKKEGKPWAATIARKASKVRAANIPPFSFSSLSTPAIFLPLLRIRLTRFVCSCSFRRAVSCLIWWPFGRSLTRFSAALLFW
jgi:hypothetical protein